MNLRRLFAVFAFLSALLCLASPPAALPANLQMDDEEELYIAIDKLNAMGLLPGFLANTRPYDMQAVREALRDKAWDGMDIPEEAADLARWVAYRTAPLAVLQPRSALFYSSDRVTRPNNDGAPTPEGWSGQFSAFGRYEPFSWLSGDGKVVGWVGERDDTSGRVDNFSVQVGHKYLSLEAGKITAWYGPGRRGALIFTNNAQAYPGVRLHNPVPIPITGFFSFLGSLQYDMFFARMDDNRAIPNTLLNGFRFALRPAQWLELGVSRAIHFGGEGQEESLSAWWKAFANTDVDTPDQKTNQLAAYDITLTLPFRTQPVQLYFEWGAEDQARGGYVIPRMAKWAILGGVFFPSILGNPDFDLRIEYADNHMSGQGEQWYTHSYSPHVYKNRVLGHPMGTNARDFSVQSRWFLLPSSYFELTLGRTDRFIPEASMEKLTGVGLAFYGWLNPSLRAGIGFDTGFIKNESGVPDKDNNIFTSWVELAWRFSGVYAYHSFKERP